MTVTPDAVEAAAKAMQARDPYCYNDGHAPSWENLSDLAKACYSDLATAALAAAAPLIAKQTLLDAAEEITAVAEDTSDGDGYGAYINGLAQAATTLTARAATLTPKEN